MSGNLIHLSFIPVQPKMIFCSRMLLTLIIFVVYLNEISVPIPHCSRPIKFTHIRLFGQFPVSYIFVHWRVDNNAISHHPAKEECRP